jgi:hypothetical protein
MTITEVLRQVSGKTTDVSGHVASYAVRSGGEVVAYLESRLDNASRTVANWRMLWTAHFRDGSNITSESSTNLKQLLSKFADADLQPTSTSKPAEFFAKFAPK